MKVLRIFLLSTLAACAETEMLTIEDDDAMAMAAIRDYDDAAHFLADNSGIIAVCRAALEIDRGHDKSYQKRHCRQVYTHSDKIKAAALTWLTATQAQQKRWFERNPYEFRDMQNAIKDFDRILHHDGAVEKTRQPQTE